jgi:hypothetical protein
LDKKFISPVAFADGRCDKLNFTHAITSSIRYPCEPMPGWYFYEPERVGQ